LRRIYLDCEFTELNATAKLISLALVAEDAREFYVELLDTWHHDDCSDFVKEIVLPQLWGDHHSCFIFDARDRLLAFLRSLDCMITVVTDAPEYDWELFCQLAYNEGKWPQNVHPAPTNALTLKPLNDGSDLPHHALLDARIIAGMFVM